LHSLLMTALKGFRGKWYIYYFRFLLLFSYIIPISMRVNLDLGKTVYALGIMRDKVLSLSSFVFFTPNLIIGNTRNSCKDKYHTRGIGTHRIFIN
jgi:hypothetical protein